MSANVTRPTEAAPATNRASSGIRPPQTYYDYPMLKTPHWRWEIVLYFFFSGIASAAYVTSAIAQLFGRREYVPVVRAGRYLSPPLLAISALLLIKDLKRPDRFHHMLRIFKTRSPMSVGTWALMIMSVFAGFSAIQQLIYDGLLGRRTLIGRFFGTLPTRVIEFIGAFAGFFVAGYTGTLLSSTAAPLWGKARTLMTPIFIASASSTAMASISLILSITGHVREDTMNRLGRAESLAIIIELGLLAVLHRTLGPLTRFLTQGHNGLAYFTGVIGGLFAPLLIQTKPSFRNHAASRSRSIVASSLVLAGGLILRYVFLKAGKSSIEDQKAAIRYTQPERKRKFV